jgi:predicted hotdog family 3-hydroxylacyl-ACP dehydratase
VLNREQIESRVPHAGAMCLIDHVTIWDATHIECTALAPAADHPLARNGGVPAVAAVEYAAQATAIHGSLIEENAAPRAGMLATLSDVQISSSLIEGALKIHAELLSRVASGCMYRFAVHDAYRCCAQGQLLVALQS